VATTAAACGRAGLGVSQRRSGRRCSTTQPPRLVDSTTWRVAAVAVVAAMQGSNSRLGAAAYHRRSRRRCCRRHCDRRQTHCRGGRCVAPRVEGAGSLQAEEGNAISRSGRLRSGSGSRAGLRIHPGPSFCGRKMLQLNWCLRATRATILPCSKRCVQNWPAATCGKGLHATCSHTRDSAGGQQNEVVASLSMRGR
jgi:hypothetical protein